MASVAGSLRQLNAINLEGSGGVSEKAVAFLEDIAPWVELVDAKVAAIEEIRQDTAVSLFPPFSGVVVRVDELGAKVKGLMRWHHYARAAIPSLRFSPGLSSARELVVTY